MLSRIMHKQIKIELERLRQEDGELEVSLIYIARPSLKNQNYTFCNFLFHPTSMSLSSCQALLRQEIKQTKHLLYQTKWKSVSGGLVYGERAGELAEVQWESALTAWSQGMTHHWEPLS